MELHSSLTVAPHWEKPGTVRVLNVKAVSNTWFHFNVLSSATARKAGFGHFCFYNSVFERVGTFMTQM